jgi:hypothetical protein
MGERERRTTSVPKRPVIFQIGIGGHWVAFGSFIQLASQLHISVWFTGMRYATEASWQILGEKH